MKLLTNRSISGKIFASFFMMLLLLIGVGIWTFQFSSIVQGQSELVLTESQPFAQLAAKLSRDIIQIQQWLTDISATRAQDGLDDGYTEAEKHYQSAMMGLQEFEVLFRRSNNQDGLQKIQELRIRIDNYYAVGKRMAQAYIDQGSSGGNLTMAEFDETAATLSEALDPFLQQQTVNLQTALQGLQHRASALKTGLVWILLTLVVAVMVIGFILSKSIANPLKRTVGMIKELENGHLGMRLRMNRGDEIGELAGTMDRFADSIQKEVVEPLQRVASGDLTSVIIPRDNEDSLRHAIRKVQDDLTRIIREVQTASEHIGSGSMQVAASSQSLAQGATESAASIEEISASINEMAGQTRMNAENATLANQLADEARKTAASGNQQMVEMVAAMGEIDAAGQDIKKIIKVIDEIAFQTNLLALNAAVEAARAGQHGKGFAVVAEEVRNLAARSAKAARETAELIESSVQKTSRGTELATETSEALDAIVVSISKATDLVAEINIASNQQAHGIEQINQGLVQIEQVTQRNTASAEESAATSEELSGQARSMNGMLSRFRLIGSGRAAGESMGRTRAFLTGRA